MAQWEIIGYRGPFFADPVAQFFLFQVTFRYKTLVTDGDFNGIQVVALNIFDQGQFEHLLVIGLPDEGRKRLVKINIRK